MYTMHWEGEKLEARMRKAIGRAALDMATDVALTAKDLAPVAAKHDPDDNPGTLVRSITIGIPGEPHTDDELRANGGEDLLATRGDWIRALDVVTQFGASTAVSVDVGSWISYACAVEIRSPYIYPAIEMVRGTRADLAMQKAWRESEFGVYVASLGEWMIVP